MLQSEGVYNYLCAAQNDGVVLAGNSTAETSCLAQSAQFDLIFVVASTGFACSVLPMGIILDRFGPKVTRCSLGERCFVDAHGDGGERV